MVEAFFLAYGIVLIAGCWLMLEGVSEAPLGYEDDDGFHYGVAPVRQGAVNPERARVETALEAVE